MRIALLGNMPNEGRAGKADKAPNRADQVVERAHNSKMMATGDWVDGRITSKEHEAIHKRADYVIKRKGKK